MMVWCSNLFHSGFGITPNYWVKPWINVKRIPPIYILILFLTSFLWLQGNAQSESKNSIPVGLLIREKADLPVQHAAELAIEQANRQGGFKGKNFELVEKFCDGPWGVGAKKVVELVYENEVPIVVAALDGRNAHLAEQVTAKSHVVLISTMSSDPSLSRAYVPWYFRLVPDDLQQSRVLLEKIYKNSKQRRVALIYFDDYDGKMSAQHFKEMAVAQGISCPELINFAENEPVLDDVINKNWDAIVFAGFSAKSSMVIQQLKSNATANLFAFKNAFNFMDTGAFEESPDHHVTSTFKVPVLSWETFRKSFHEKYGYFPSPSLVFVYDGMMMATAAIKKFGPDPESIRSGFRSLNYKGLTGPVHFDKLGNRQLKLTVDP